MFGIRTFNDSIKEVANSKLDYFFMLYNFIFFSRIVGVFLTDFFLTVNLFIVVFFCLIKNRLIINKSLLYIIIIYCAVSIVPAITFGFNFSVYFGYLLRLITAYFIISYYGFKFINVFSNLVYILAYVSLPLFIIQVLLPDIYTVLYDFTNALIFEQYKNLRAVYMLIYYINPAAFFRNSGFMSEPSSFASVLVWSLLIQLYSNNFKLNTKIIIHIVALITTFSIGAYIYLVIVSIMFVIANLNKKTLKYIGRFIVGGVFLTYLGYKLPVVQDNIDMILYKIEVEDSNYAQVEGNQLGVEDISRVSGAIINMQYFFKFPFGYGLVAGNKLNDEYRLVGHSPNGLSIFIVRWGISFLVLVYLSTLNFIRILKFKCNVKYNIVYLLTGILYILPLAGYSFFNQPLILTFFLFPLLLNVKLLKSKL